MVMNTQFYYDYSISLDHSSKKSIGVNSKSDDNSSKLFNTSKPNSNISNNKSFNEVFKSTKQSQVNNKNDKKNDKEPITTSDKNSKIDELKRKIDELKEEVNDGKHDEKKVNDILAELLNALNNLLGKTDISEALNNADNQNSLLIEKIFSNNSDELQNLQDVLCGDLLKDMKELLKQLSGSLNDESSDKMNNGVNAIISKLDEILQNGDSQEKVTNSDTLFNQNSTMENDDSSAGMADKKSDTKEDKFLNSLLDDKNDSVDNKINLFAARTQSVQNQNTEVRGLSINKATFADDLIKDVKFMSENNIKELTVKVNPGNLGEITIKIVQEDGLMKANLKANSKETTALLSQNLAEIKKELSDQNIKISEVNIDLYNEDTTFFKNESFGGQLSQEQGNGKSTSQNSRNINIENVDTEEVLDDSLAMLDNSLDFLV